MKDEVFEKLSIHQKLVQIRKAQRSALWYNYMLFVFLVLLMTALMVIR
jgi:hypothetical protein